MIRALIVALLGVISPLAQAQAQTSGEICAVDLDGDGAADAPGEQAVCVNSGGQSLCPIQAVQCTGGNQSGPPIAVPTATVTILDDDTPTGPYRITVTPVVTEPATGATQLHVDVNFGGIRFDRVMAFGAVSGSAEAGFDFVDPADLVDIVAFQTSFSFDVDIIGDGISEPNEWFQVFVYDTRSAAATRSTRVVTISDPASAPGAGVAIGSIQVTEGSSGSTSVTVPFTLSAPLTYPVDVTFQTRDGTAVAGADYVPLTGTVTFAPGQIVASASIEVVGDIDPENPEDFYVDITGVTGGSAPVCPLNPTQACIPDGSGASFCSPNSCFLQSSIVQQITDPPDSGPLNNGPRDADGACIGDLQIFAGESSRCRKAGVQDTFQNCCKSHGNVVQDEMGGLGSIGLQLKVAKTLILAAKAAYTGGIAAANQVLLQSFNPTTIAIGVAMSVLTEMIFQTCDDRDMGTAMMKDSGMCVFVGTYCAESWPLVGCVQKAERHCCFNSKLARIIQEQGRVQLPGMGGFGTPEAPNCRGFRPEEFQALDFSKIDMSEYYEEIRAKSQAVLEGEVRTRAMQQIGQ